MLYEFQGNNDWYQWVIGMMEAFQEFGNLMELGYKDITDLSRPALSCYGTGAVTILHLTPYSTTVGVDFRTAAGSSPSDKG